MEEKQQIILANQDGGTVTGGAPTFFVILKQPGNGKTDQGILVTNRDARALLSRESSPGKSKEKICLPADCTVGKITVTLDNNSMWNEFHNRSTEMILTKQGRRMFPYCRYWITGLDSNLKYILVMDISPVDSHRYKWNGRWWEPSGKAEPHILGRVFIHPESPSPVMVVTPVVSSEQVQVCSTVAAAVTTSPQVFLENVTAVPSLTANSDMGAKEATYSSSASTAGVVEISETNNTTLVTSTQSTATVNLTKTTGITTSPVASVSFAKPLVASPTITLPVASTASTSIVMVTTAASSSVVTTPTSSLSSVPIILSGINGSPPVSQRPENAPQIPVTTPQISSNNVKRTGPRLLLIPVQQGSPTLRPIQNPQLQGQRMVLQPVRGPSGMNLFRHPNGQIVQLLPLHQIRGSNAQPSLQPVVFRNPGSMVGIRLPAPCKSSETPSSSASSSASRVLGLKACATTPGLDPYFMESHWYLKDQNKLFAQNCCF